MLKRPSILLILVVVTGLGLWLAFKGMESNRPLTISKDHRLSQDISEDASPQKSTQKNQNIATSPHDASATELTEQSVDVPISVWKENDKHRLAKSLADANAKVKPIVQDLVTGRRQLSELKNEEKDLLRERVQILADAIETTPELALQHRLPVFMLKKFGGDMNGLVEEWVEGRTDLFQIYECGEGTHKHWRDVVFWEETPRTYRAHVYGRRDEVSTREKIPLHGIAVEGHMAVHESPMRLLEPGEEGFEQGKLVASFGGELKRYESAEAYRQDLVSMKTMENLSEGPLVHYESSSQGGVQ